MIKTGWLLLAISLSILITYPSVPVSYHPDKYSVALNNFWEPSIFESLRRNDMDDDKIRDFDLIVEGIITNPESGIESLILGRQVADICYDENFRFRYHEDCLKRAGLRIPLDADFEEAQEEFDDIVERKIGTTLNLTWPSEEITYEEVNIKTCFDFEGGLLGYKWSMYTRDAYHRFQAILGTFSEFGRQIFSALVNIYQPQTESDLDVVVEITNDLAEEAHTLYADVFEEYTDSAQTVEDGPLCDENTPRPWNYYEHIYRPRPPEGVILPN
ncbi:MAG: hypothetical protein OXH31_07010 [Gammaproteobacteria bacterium]|nr:hypothetical protein [Gammaproteobacteria bacterium]